MLTAKKIKSIIEILTAKDKHKLIICENQLDELIALSYSALLKASLNSDNHVYIAVSNEKDLEDIYDFIHSYIVACDIETQDTIVYKNMYIFRLSNKSSITIRFGKDGFARGRMIDHLFVKVNSKEDIESEEFDILVSCTLVNANSTISIFMNPNTNIDSNRIIDYRKITIR